MDSLEHRAYGGGYTACIGCKIQTRIVDLVDGRCVKCRPGRTCTLCLFELEGTAGEHIDSVWACRDRAACAERIWRTAEKAAVMRADREFRAGKPVPRYLHHNVDCDYVNGWWQCPEPCGVSDLPLYPDDQ